jgi:hypothetical protein
MWMSNVETFLFNDKDKDIHVETNNVQIQSRQSRAYKIYLPVTWTVRIIDCPYSYYYSPNYSKPSESLLMASLLVEATGAASS